jgi:transposase
MAKKYIVTLTEEERGTLRGILKHGKHSAGKRNRAQALLAIDEGLKDEAVKERTGMSVAALEKLRQRFVEEGFQTTLDGKPRGHRAALIQGADEARLTMLACSEKPEGHSRWTLRLLADKFVIMESGEHVSHETIRRTLKKTI